MKEYKVPIPSLIDHIKTAIDVDPWAKEMVEELLKEQEWIPVGERLPETEDEVLTTYIVNGNQKKRYVETASYFNECDGEGHWDSVWDEYWVGGAKREVIAWIPLPKPYKQ